MAQMILSTFSEKTHAEDAINDLEKRGFNPKDISIVMKSTEEATTVVENTGASVADGMTAGATTGGVIGGLTGLLIGIGAIVVPGIGGLLIGGPIASALGLTGAAATTISGAVTGALAGGLLGALVGLGVPEEEARVYEDTVKTGGILVMVPVEEKTPYVADVLSAHGADNVHTVDMRENK